MDMKQDFYRIIGKSTLFVFMICVAKYQSFAQRNLIYDSNFENTTLSRIDKADYQFNKGEWCFFSTDEEKGKIYVVGDEHQGSAISFQVTSAPDIFNFYVGQRINEPLLPVKYRIGFSARSMQADRPGMLSLYLRINDNQPSELKFFELIKPLQPAKRPIAEIKISNNWDYYTVDFDLSKTLIVNHDLEIKESVESSESALNNCCLAFSATYGNTLLRLTDVSFKPLK